MGANFLKGLLFGSTVGGLSGLLLAPKSGKKTRQDFSAELTDLKEAGLGVKDSLAKVQQAAETLQQTADTLLPTFQKEMEKDLRAYHFMVEPRLAQLNEQLEKIQQKTGADKQKRAYHLNRPSVAQE